MEKLLADFVAAYIGVPNTGDTPGNRGQCVGLIEVWLDSLHLKHIWGNAKDLMDFADQKVYTVVPNAPANVPPTGAILVWGATWGAGYGHTAVVVLASVMHVVVFEQNNPEGGAPTLGAHRYDGVIGWIVPKGGGA